MNSKKRLLNIVAGLMCFLGLVLLCMGLGRSFGGLNPIGELLSPATGLWRHEPTRAADLILKLEAAVREAGLPKVEIEVDQNEVPHLTSESDSSLYFAQGFVTAYYRLWQMDFLSRITAGEVSEILGEKALPVDRFFRRMRIPAAARASADLMMADPVTKGPLSSYSRGVNARISQLDVKSVPIEYRLFGILPEAWTEARAAYLLKFMTWELTGYLYDFRMTASKAKLSHEIFEFLFPLNAKMPGSILKDKFVSSKYEPEIAVRLLANRHWEKPPEEAMPEAANGSNNWAVPARMMSNHRALLANDLHLGYTLPALWFSIQLTSPTMNVYGASLPGAPGVIVGFTESMGWAVTNGSDDVLDWYSLRFRDSRRQEYMFDNSWRPVVTREELVNVAGGKKEVVKTRETHVGPIVFEEGEPAAVVDIPAGLAVQWTGHIPSNELRSFLLLNHGVNAKDCMTALKGYVAPAQNFVCADRLGRIAYKHAGLFPNRRGRDGRMIFEASTDADLWQGTLSPEENPSFETSTDLVVTANQAPFSGDGLSRYGWFFASPYRALQIRSRIDERKVWKPEQMIEIQGDTKSWLAGNFKKIILREANENPLKDEIAKDACGVKSMSQWNGEHDAGNTIAPLMHQWLKNLEEATWTRIIGKVDQTYWPSSWRFFEIMENEPASLIWSGLKSGLNSRLAESLVTACENLKTRFGGDGKTSWSNYQSTFIRHTGRIPGFGRAVQTGGVAESIFANKGQHGPTWKMIVTFEDVPRAWTMIPGGQSGDPSSPLYDDHVTKWARGEMQAVKFNMPSKKRSTR